MSVFRFARDKIAEWDAAMAGRLASEPFKTTNNANKLFIA